MLYAGSVQAHLEAGLSYRSSDSILYEESIIENAQHQSSGRNSGVKEPYSFISHKRRIEIIQEASCCPGGSITLLICRNCLSPYDKHYIRCQKCNNRLIRRCQTKTCPANTPDPDKDSFCWHANYSTDAIKVMVRPVMCHLIDLITFGKGKYLHGVHRSGIVLDLQYIKENDLVNTESSLNSYAFFSSLGETAICESMKVIHSNTKPTNLRNFLENEKPFPLSTESMNSFVIERSDVMTMDDIRVSDVEKKGRELLGSGIERLDGSTGEKLSMKRRGRPASTGKKQSKRGNGGQSNSESCANESIRHSQKDASSKGPYRLMYI